MKIFKKIFNTIVNILIVLVLVVSILFAAISFASEDSELSQIFGYTMQPIMTPSMDGGNDMYGGEVNQYDLLFCKATDFDEKAEYEVGDIITYRGILKGTADNTEGWICHRIVDVAERNGEMVYRTKGDNADYDQNEVADYLAARSIGSVYYSKDFEGFKIPYIGYAFSHEGFLYCVLLPMIIFFLYILVRVVIDAMNYKNAKLMEEREKNADSKTAQMSDEEYEEFKAFMASKKAEKENDSATDSEDSDSESSTDENIDSDDVNKD